MRRKYRVWYVILRTYTYRSWVRNPRDEETRTILLAVYSTGIIGTLYWEGALHQKNAPISLELHDSPQLLDSLIRDRFEEYYHQSLGAGAVCHACMCRVHCVMIFSEHKTACVQLWIRGHGFEPRQALLVKPLLFAFYFCLPFFLSFFFEFHMICVFDQSAPRIHSLRN